ncbi:MAG: DUF4242 domain-containing protein [Rubrobacter sp.]
MPTYLLVRNVGDFSEDDMKAGLGRAEEVGEQIPDVRWIRSYYSAAEGKLYCEYEAPSLELLLEFDRRVGMPVDHATVVQNLEPSMFR